MHGVGGGGGRASGQFLTSGFEEPVRLGAASVGAEEKAPAWTLARRRWSGCRGEGRRGARRRTGVVRGGGACTLRRMGAAGGLKCSGRHH
jgi:hypothetical protein